LKTINNTIEIIAGKQLIYDNIPLITLTKEVSDERLLIELLNLKFKERLSMIDLEKKSVYGIQFYRFDGNEKLKTSKQWSEKYNIHIFSDLCFYDIRDVFNAIGYKLKHNTNNRQYAVSKYELIPLKRKLFNQ